jgi:AraC family ethanolamine operon transcriptional activator
MSCPSHQRVVQRALALIEEHAGESVSTADMCQATHVSERTLRNAFHEVYGISPKQYRIRCGLEQAHRALLAAHGVRGAVTQVATEYGFFELGRFAEAYRHLFSELPSETLRSGAKVAAF